MTDRKALARVEMTGDPIFLLQSAQLAVADPGYFDAVDEMTDDGELSREDEKALIDRGLAVLAWDTVSVWYTREEAETFRVAHAYRWRSGSRVFCVNAEGELAQVLAGGPRGA